MFQPFLDPVDHPRHGGIDLCAHFGEGGGIAVVGVVNVGTTGRGWVEGAEQADFFGGNSVAHKVVNVPVVQGHKEVSIVVFGAKLGGSVLCAVVSRSLKFRNGAPVSGLTNMPATNTAGTYEDIVGEVGVVKRVAEDDISHRGAADVSRADEDDVEAFSVPSHG